MILQRIASAVGTCLLTVVIAGGGTFIVIELPLKSGQIRRHGLGVVTSAAVRLGSATAGNCTHPSRVVHLCIHPLQGPMHHFTTTKACIIESASRRMLCFA
ncbi:hypothetical protein K437DRAFT_259896 [Tilletiaria anomala UBC 951]|uniref:Uncharacterized protein n=1 Tax=Tilletiaria anomala (strain ATCC 24038 / CBS 436.72 / UBC 951) TaxID=1037660 RepID=A0A066VAA6_TILAU|nr:uncharacterized protein K437DRAFT_259896 [Tilletiaria anomala UBC 951]KDN37223.1 hypothetical protein K437DRAFT_259896 [Tilletiaria anomala UBC 951]